LRLRPGLLAGALVVLAVLLAWWWAQAAPGGKAEAGRRGRRPAAAAGAGGGSVGVGSRDLDRSGEGKIRGRVVDLDGMPVTEGRVILHCLRPMAEQSFPIDGGAIDVGPEGEFVGPGCRGLVCAEFRHTSLLPREPWVFEANRAEQTVTARPLERITGTVLDPAGQPVAGATLMVRRGRDDDPTALPPFTARNTVSDADGVFNFARVERPPCDPCGEASGRCEPGDAIEVPTYNTMVLIARAPGFRSVEQPVELAEGDWPITLLPPLAPVSGTLLDPDGQPYPRARVLARSRLRSYEVHQARVEGGVFRFTAMGAGDYDLRALQDGALLATATEVEAGAQLEMVGSRPASGPGLVVELRRSDDGAAVSGAQVDGGPFTGARTDEEGEVRAEDVAPGSYALVIRAPGAGTQRREIEVPAAEMGAQEAIVRRFDIVYNAP
jgi:hypothetical protein